jgi:hypothetical protein
MFRLISISTAAICFVLFGLFLIAPGFYTEVYGVAADRGGDFLGRRASPMFLGLAVILWLNRNAPPTLQRQSISYGIATVFAGIAFTGLFEFGRGNASFNIVIAAIGEMLIAFAFLVAARR